MKIKTQIKKKKIMKIKTQKNQKIRTLKISKNSKT